MIFNFRQMERPFFFKEVMMSDLMQSFFSPRQYVSFLWDHWWSSIIVCVFLNFFFLISLELSISHISQMLVRSSTLKYSAWLVSQSGWTWTIWTVLELKDWSAKLSVFRKLCGFVKIRKGIILYQKRNTVFWLGMFFQEGILKCIWTKPAPLCSKVCQLGSLATCAIRLLKNKNKKKMQQQMHLD